MSHYSNFNSRLQLGPAKTVRPPARRKAPAPKRQRALLAGALNASKLAAVLALAIGAAVTAQADPFNIITSPGLFTPSFRDANNTDLGNTTFFGWGPAPTWNPNRFDGVTPDGLIDNPATSQGIGGLTGTLNQVGTDIFLASSKNIYTAAFPDEALTLSIPLTGGTIGLGFTTIIIQGRSTSFGPDPVVYAPGTYGFPVVGGDTPDIVFGPDASGFGQFWVKYEIPGYQPNYTFDFHLLNENVSIAELQVDTQWSSTGYAADTAVATPEPSAGIALVGGVGLLMSLRRRRSQSMSV